MNTKRTAKAALLAAAAVLCSCARNTGGQDNTAAAGADGGALIIATQGHFAVGGTTIQREGSYDNSRFVGWSEQDERGQSFRADHAFVSYQIPANAHKAALVYVHGFGGSGVCWQMTADGREGFATLMLRRGWSAYVVDLPGRGRAGRTSAQASVQPVADEMFWFDIWRLGVWPVFNEGVQFPQDDESLSQFFREMTPDLSDHTHDEEAISAVATKVGDCVLVTHSAGGLPGWRVAMQNANVKAVASYEPGGFVFPEGELPPRIDGLTGGVAGTPVTSEEFERLARIPIVLYFGDYIPEEVSDKLGDENWRVRLQMARLFVEAVRHHGGRATLVELPKVGIRGNTHFLMQDLNNGELAWLLDEWLASNLGG